MEPTSSPDGARLVIEIVNASLRRLCLIDLATSTVLAMSDGAAEIFGQPADEIVGTDVLALSADPISTRARVKLISTGRVSAYETPWRFNRVDGGQVDVRLWVRVLADQVDPAVALVAFGASDGDHYELRSLGSAAGSTRRRNAAVGVMNEHFVVENVSREAVKMLGITEGILDQPFVTWVEAEDRELLSDLIATVLETGVAFETKVRVRLNGVSARMRVIVSPSPSSEGPRLGFLIRHDASDEVVTPDAGELADRATALERQLMHLLAEIRDVALVSRMAAVRRDPKLPGITGLTARQWEVVTLLIRGVRVPEIAETLYLSQSTVRNHLSAVYRLVGVGSQVELIRLLTSGIDN